MCIRINQKRGPHSKSGGGAHFLCTLSFNLLVNESVKSYVDMPLHGMHAEYYCAFYDRVSSSPSTLGEDL